MRFYSLLEVGVKALPYLGYTVMTLERIDG